MPAEVVDKLVFYVNGRKHEIRNADPEVTLLQYLRSPGNSFLAEEHSQLVDVGLTGTKLGCGEGGCGACTVTLSRYDSKSDKIRWLFPPSSSSSQLVANVLCRHCSVNACLAPLCSADGAAVTTVEGIGSVSRGLHPVQVNFCSAMDYVMKKKEGTPAAYLVL